MRQKILVPLILTILVFILMRMQGASLFTSYSPGGIIEFELARTPEQVQKYLLLWKNSVIKWNITIDFFFIIAYTWLLYNWLQWIRQYLQTPIRQNINSWLSKAVVLVGVLDVLENCLMLFTIKELYNAFSLEATYWFAVIKFALAGLTLVYILLNSVLIAVSNKQS
jgi:hypothetical protein